jgi:very-short-patch-repair endonuclease
MSLNKLFLNETFSKEVEKTLDKNPKTVNNLLGNIARRLMNEYFILLDECDSPIEQLMGLALQYRMDKQFESVNYLMVPQENVDVEGKKYRVDFLIVIVTPNKPLEFVVECDGHDFHEKTKEQAKRDKSRDRDLLKRYSAVLRFTGSEINNDPFGCANEVIDIIKTHIERCESK